MKQAAKLSSQSTQIPSVHLCISQLKLESFGQKHPPSLRGNVAQGATGSFHFGIGLPDFASTKETAQRPF